MCRCLSWVFTGDRGSGDVGAVDSYREGSEQRRCEDAHVAQAEDDGQLL